MLPITVLKVTRGTICGCLQTGNLFGAVPIVAFKLSAPIRLRTMTHLSTKLVPVRFSMDESRVVHRATPFWALEVSTEGRTRSLCRRSSSVDKLSGSKMSLERGSTAWLSVSGRPQIASSEHVSQALVSVASMLPTRRPLLKRLQDFR